jgi:sugar lactone lactonase YvrE
MSSTAAPAGSTSSTSNSDTSLAGPALRGVLHGGQSPITGATLNLFAAGQPATATAGYPIGLAISDSVGQFSITYTCPSAGSLIYIVADGGNAGGGANPAIRLMAALGPCGTLPSSIVVNELTTVAAVYALNAFSYINNTAAGLGGCVDCASTTRSDMTDLHGNSPAMNNAFQTAALLADVTTGAPAKSLPASVSCSAGLITAPVNCSALQKLTGLGNSLAACVNSASGSTQCAMLFECAVPGSSFDLKSSTDSCVVPTGATESSDTLGATLSIARNPGSIAISGIAYLAARNVVFSPGLTNADDWTIALNFTGGGLAHPAAIAIDGAGDVWVANNSGGSVTELNAGGVAISPPTGFTGGGLGGEFEYALAIDGAGDVWVANFTGSSVTELNAGGNPLSPPSGFDGGENPQGIAVDGAGNIWVADHDNSVMKLDANGNLLSPAGGYTAGGLYDAWGIAVDGTGNVWVTDAGVGASGGNSVTKLTAGGNPLSPATGFTGGRLDNPVAIAIDSSGNAWVANETGNSVTEFSSSGSVLSPAGITLNEFAGGGLNAPYAIAIDGAGNVWLPNSGSSTVTEFNSKGTPLSPYNFSGAAGGFTGGGLSTPSGIAIDQAGDVWVTDSGSSSVTEVIGAAAPVMTPLVASIAQPAAVLSSIAVTPTSADVTVGGTQQFTATGTYSNDSTMNLTGTVAWSSSNSAVATVASTGGLATCVAPGTVSVTASLAQGEATITGFVTQGLVCSAPVASLVSIAVTPAAPSIAVGATQQFTATGTYSDGTTQNLTSTATWASASTAIATLSSSTPGLASGVAAGGPDTISAAVTPSGGTVVTGTAQLTVAAPVTGPACYAAPASPGGGTDAWDNQSYCVPFSGSTDMNYVFTGTLSFTTALGGGALVQCQYWSSGTVNGTGSASTGPTTCAGSFEGGPNLIITDTSDNYFELAFSTTAIASGSLSANVFGPGGGAGSGTVTSTGPTL